MVTSCSTSDYINDESPKTLVVEGWIANNEPPIVMLSTIVGVSTEVRKMSSLDDHVIHWGKVTICDGEKNVVLTGYYDEKYFPPYIYTTTDMKGKIGQSYTLTAEYEGLHASAITSIPEPVELESVEQEKIEGVERYRLLKANFVDPTGDNYYCLFDKIGLESQQFTKCDVGSFDDKIFADGHISYPLFRAHTYVNQNKERYYEVGNYVCVRLATMTEQSYNFWSDYQNSASLSGNFYTPYTKNLRSNIVGGYGYWCGYGVSDKWIYVER
jgi:hypothetical protein